MSFSYINHLRGNRFASLFRNSHHRIFRIKIVFQWNCAYLRYFCTVCDSTRVFNRAGAVFCNVRPIRLSASRFIDLERELGVSLLNPTTSGKNIPEEARN